MKFIYHILFGIITGFTLLSCNSQTRTNTDLKNELDAIMFTDQAFRRQYDSNMSEKESRDIADSLNLDYDTMRKDLLVLMNKYDAENIKKVETIISKYGYPGKSLVGEPTNNAAFLVIQHSDKIPKYLPLIKSAAEKKDLSFISYALMLDRYLMEKKEEQIYGSQGLDIGGTAVIWPIKNPSTVNKLRKKAGFTQTIEKYSKDLFGDNFKYIVYSLEEIKELFSGITIVE